MNIQPIRSVVLSTVIVLISIVANAQEETVSSRFFNLTDQTGLSVDKKEQVLDSLLLEQNLARDTIAIAEVYYELIKDCWRSDLRKATRLANTVYLLGLQSNTFEADIFTRVNFNRVLFNEMDLKPYDAISAAKDYLKLYALPTVRLGRVYRLLGNSYKAIGDIENSILNYEESVRILSTLDNVKEITTTYLNIVATCAKFEDEAYFDYGMSIVDQVDENQLATLSQENRGIFYLNSGTLFDLVGLSDRAIESLEKSAAIGKQEQDSSSVVIILSNLSHIYKELHQLQKADACLKDAESYCSNNPQDLAIVKNNFGGLYLRRNQFEEAIKSYQDAIVLGLNNTNADQSSLPSIEELSITPFKAELLNDIIDKGKAYLTYYRSSTNSSLLSKALECFELADELLDIVYFESRENLSKLSWRKRATTLYDLAIETCYLKGETASAFKFMEKNSAIVLLENIKDYKAKELANLSDEVMQQELDLKQEIRWLEEDVQFSDGSDATIDSLKSMLFKAKSDYSAFIQSLEKDYPEFYNYKKNLKIIDLKAVQNSLAENQAVICYHQGETECFALLISKNAQEFKQVGETAQLEKLLTQYKAFHAKPLQSTSEMASFREVSHELYTMLFPFDDVTKSVFNKQLCITSNGSLPYISFESLVITLGGTESEFLVAHAGLYYTHSLSILENMKAQGSTQEHDVVSFFPSAYEDKALPSLVTSGEEFNVMQGLFSTPSFKSEAATKQKFFDHYGNAKVVHISTHGGVENDTPWLAFQNENLNLDELFFMGNEPELVVLSACKTSEGKLQKGEGVMSMSREFVKSGAKSVLSALWEVNAKSGLEITNSFYKELKEGRSKSESLRLAKLNYLDKHKGTSEASPFYWSGIILVGVNDPISFSSEGMGMSIILLVLGGLILIIGIIFFIRKLKREV